MTVRKRTARLAAVLAAAGVAVASLAAGAGTADAAKLPGTHKSKKVPGGSISIRLFDQRYSIQRAVTNTPLSREVWVSGKVRVQTAGELKGGTVVAGYLIGCQLDFGASGTGSGGITTSTDDQFTATVPGPNGTPITVPTPLDSSSGVGAGFTLGPGQAKFVPIIKTSVNGTSVDSFSFTDARGGVAYSQERFGVDGCAGFAQARALVNVKVSSDEFKGNVTLYGVPFSIG